MNNDYEAIFIIKDNNGKNDVDRIIQEINNTVEDAKGKIYHKDEIGHKKLAYEIRGCKEAFYYLINYKDKSSRKDASRHITTKINTMEEVIKIIIVKKCED